MNKPKFWPILVKDVSFESKNGMSGLNMLSFIHLCNVMGRECDNLRKVFGMCKEHYNWKNSLYFVRHRKKCVPPSLKTNFFGKYKIVNTPIGETCSLSHEKEGKFDYIDYNAFRTMYLDIPLSKDVWRWTVQFVHGKVDRIDTVLAIGAIPADRFTKCFTKCLGDYTVPGSAAISFSFGRWPQLTMLGVGNEAVSLYPVGTRIPDMSLVVVEANLGFSSRTLSFFVNGEKVPHVITNLPVTPALYLGVSLRGECPCFVSRALRRQTAPTPSAAACTVHKCKAY